MDGTLQPGFYSGQPGPVMWGTADHLVAPGSHTVRWTLQAGQQAGTNATAWLDSVALSPGDTQLGAALDNTNLAWAGYPWSVDVQGGGVFTGGSAAKSPPTPDYGGAGLYTVIAGPAELRFAWRVDSAPGDFLQLYIDGQLHSLIDGTNGFPLQEVTVNVGPGNHSLMWMYQKNASGSAGADAGWVDHVRVTPVLKPFITYDPPDLVVTEGQPTGFSLIAVSPEPMTYQWYHGAPLAERTNDWLPFATAQVSDAGNYFVVVANTFGSTTSRVARLTVTAFRPSSPTDCWRAGCIPAGNRSPRGRSLQPAPAHLCLAVHDERFCYDQRAPERDEPALTTSPAWATNIPAPGAWWRWTWPATYRPAPPPSWSSARASTTSIRWPMASQRHRRFGQGHERASGTVVGQVGYGGLGTPRAYKFNRYGDTVLDGTIYSNYGQANGINAGGLVVGRAMGPTGMARAVRWVSSRRSRRLGRSARFCRYPFRGVGDQRPGTNRGQRELPGRGRALRLSVAGWPLAEPLGSGVGGVPGVDGGLGDQFARSHCRVLGRRGLQCLLPRLGV